MPKPNKKLAPSAQIIQRLVKYVGSYRKLAYAITISEYALEVGYQCSHEIVRSWAIGDSRINAQASLCVHYLYGTPLSHLRPDIWSLERFPETYHAPKRSST